jgi:hypothetical protein
MFTDVLEEHAAFILRVENQVECGKCGMDIRRGVAGLVALTEPNQNMKNCL